MSIKPRSRTFAPRPFTTLLTIALMILLVSLGRWQLRRADEKRALFDAFAAGTDSTVVIDGSTPPLPRYRHIAAHGRYDPARQVLIDNMSNAAGAAGYFVITPFALSGGGWLLVNRGWVPMGARSERPAIAVADDVRALRGRTDHLPSAGIAMGDRALLAPPYPVVANFPNHAELERLLQETRWAPAAELVLLDADEPGGYVRQWQAPGFPPLRHVAYAVQWFALACALAVIYVVTNLRREPGKDGNA